VQVLTRLSPLRATVQKVGNLFQDLRGEMLAHRSHSPKRFGVWRYVHGFCKRLPVLKTCPTC